MRRRFLFLIGILVTQAIFFFVLLASYDDKEHKNLQQIPKKSVRSSVHSSGAVPVTDNFMQTTWKCYRNEDFTDICVYENLCYNGETIIFLNSTSLTPQSIYNPSQHVTMNDHFGEPYPYNPPPSQFIPHLATFSQTPFQIHPKHINYQFINNSLFFIPPSRNSSLWDQSMNIMNLWQSQILNKTLQNKFPAMDWIVSTSTQTSSTFSLQNLFTRGAIQDHSQFILPEQVVEPGKTICSSKSVIISPKPWIFTGRDSGYCFRQRLYNLSDVFLPYEKGIHERDLGENNPIFSNRVAVSKSILRHGDVTNLAYYYSLELCLIPSVEDSRVLVEFFSQMDVFIASQEDLMYLLLLPPHSVVIEVIMNHERKSPLWHAAAALGIQYITINSDSCYRGTCTDLFSIQKLEEALINAYDWIGVQLNSRVDHLFDSTYPKVNQSIHRFGNQLAETQELRICSLDGMENREVSHMGSQQNISLEYWKTAWNCYRQEDLSDICVYENICYDGERLVFLDPDAPFGEPVILSHEEADLEFGEVYWELRGKYPPETAQYVPRMSGMSKRQSPVRINSHQIKAYANTEIWEGGLYHLPTRSEVDNIWIDMMETLSLWDAYMLNETSNSLPPMDWILLKGRNSLSQTFKEILRSITQPQTKFLLDDWITGNLHESDPIRRRNVESLSQNNLICSHRSVVLAQKPQLFSGSRSFHMFRERLFHSLKIPLPNPKGISLVNNEIQSVISRKVMIDVRPRSQHRHLVNNKQIANLVSYYGLEPIVQSSFERVTPIEDIARQLSEVDAYFIVHGAGETNALFMTPHSSLIEIFPVGIHVPMYNYMAKAMNLNYIEVLSQLKGPIENGCGAMVHHEDWFNQCNNESFISSTLSMCFHWAKRSCVVAPLQSVENALLDAYHYLGVDLTTTVNSSFSALHNNKWTNNNYHANDNFLLMPKKKH